MAKREVFQNNDSIIEPKYLADDEDFWGMAPFGWLYWMDSIGGEIRRSSKLDSDRVIFTILYLMATNRFDNIRQELNKETTKRSKLVKDLRKDNFNFDLLDKIAKEINKVMKSYDFWEDYMVEYGQDFYFDGTRKNRSLKKTYAAYRDETLSLKNNKTGFLWGITDVEPQGFVSDLEEFGDETRGKGNVNRTYRVIKSEAMR